MNTGETKKTTAAENLMQLMSFTADKALEMADANSIIGEKIEVEGMTIIPISKVSSGFAGGGATREDISLMTANVSPELKIKAAGGIKTKEDAEDFILLGADRLGTSRLVSIAKNEAANGEY